MKLKTIEKYIKYGNKPYTKILERAEYAGLSVVYRFNEIIISDNSNHDITLYPYNIDDIDDGMVFIAYGY